MAAPIKHEGHCLCKKVTYVVEAEEEMTFICYCQNCQHVSGSAFTYMKAMPKAQFSILTGEDLVKEYDDWDTRSGHVAKRYFCSNCGSPLYGKKYTGVTIMHVGSLEGGKESKDKPSSQGFGGNRPAWAPEFPGH